MPGTLCFIKDKHKIMEHKIPLETYFAGLLQKDVSRQTDNFRKGTASQ